VGGEKRQEKSLRIDVHHADAVVWEPVYRTHLSNANVFSGDFRFTLARASASSPPP
jgi:alkylated DNA repair dioxygenase AlkB